MPGEFEGNPYGRRTMLPIADVRFSQASIFPTLTNGTPLSEFFQILLRSGWNDDFEPPRVVRVKAKGGPIYVAFDNRRSVSLRWMSLAGRKETANFRVYDADTELIEEVKSADIGLHYSKFSIDVSEAELKALAESVGIPLKVLASQRSFKRGDKPKTWGDVLLARTSSQRQWGAPEFPLLGQTELPWVKWDILDPYVAHCRHLRGLPKDHPIVRFAQPRCMFDRRSEASLVEFFQTMPSEHEALKVVDGIPEFSPDWSRFLASLHSWCDDVLEGNVHCSNCAWRPATIRLDSIADGTGHIRGVDLIFGATRVDMVVSLQWEDGEMSELVELEVPVAEREPKVTAMETEAGDKQMEAVIRQAEQADEVQSDTTLQAPEGDSAEFVEEQQWASRAELIKPGPASWTGSNELTDSSELFASALQTPAEESAEEWVEESGDLVEERQRALRSNLAEVVCHRLAGVSMQQRPGFEALKAE
eukprot:CAMPEP_0171286592 /NCGR_PEP_ID=MMETSP0790-20130122/69108_1 /TAXON_ID=2925 /ORGANISM="Alexandrium catenella, Strain OF101" /LENGTH=475 /DNA_ID=CAMNT_0011756073 /DNA_START=95 /DNA_END=1522 /DNA_ORIENTATION=-